MELGDKKTAFLMIGHGSERKGTKTVPKGCVLVVPTRSGERVTGGVSFQNQRKFLDLANRAAILDPIHHTAELFKLFGPVSIFIEGDEYPDFQYSLFDYHRFKPRVNSRVGGSLAHVFLSGLVSLEENIPANPLLIESIRHVSSGRQEYVKEPEPGTIEPMHFSESLLNIPFLLVDGKEPDLSAIQAMNSDERKRVFKYTMTVLNPRAAETIRSLGLPNTYTFSDAFNEILTPEWMHDKIEKDLESYSEERPRPASISMTVREYIEDVLLDEEFDYSQEELFDMGGPGAYYNFVCRSMEPNSEPTPFKLATATLRGISEAETRRKKVVRNAYLVKGGRRLRKRMSGAKTKKRKSSRN